jgi:hypothetical protein
MKSNSKIYIFILGGPLGKAVHQAVLKKATQTPKTGHFMRPSGFFSWSHQ